MADMILIEVEIPNPAVCEIEAEAEPQRECVVECKERRMLDHDVLINRDKADQHPMSAITGLLAELNRKATNQALAAETERATSAEQALDEKIDNLPQPDLSPYAKKSELARVATTGKYADLTGQPTIPSQATDVHALPDTTKYGASLYLSLNPNTFKITAWIEDQDGNRIGEKRVIDLPLESVVVNGAYDAQTKQIILTLQNGNTITIPVADLVAGLQEEITPQNKLSSDLVDDTNKTHKFVTEQEKTTWNNKQPAGDYATNTALQQGLATKQNTISDLDAIRSGAAAGSTAVQPAAITNMQVTTNLVTIISSSSTDTQYPSAKCVYDIVGNIESLLYNINSGS